MKILYSAGNRLGSNFQLQRFLTSLSKEHTVRVAAYLKSSQSFNHIDWTLDALIYNTLHHKRSHELQKVFNHRVPLVNLNNAKIFLKEVESFEPDLIVSDGEPIAAHVAKTLGVRLWYCSPLHLLDGIIWERGQLKYCYFLELLKKSLNKYPEAERIFVYSPFGDINFRPMLRNGYEWISPYIVDNVNISAQYNTIGILNDFDRFPILTKLFNSLSEKIALATPFSESFTNIDHYPVDDHSLYASLLKGCKRVITTGETSYVADAFYYGKGICVAPNLNDCESLLNAILVQEYGIGLDMAQVELMGSYALDVVEQALSFEVKKKFLSKQEKKYLHQHIEDICTT